MRRYLHLPRLNGGKPLSQLLLDLDDFKRINDAHGHQMGDETLRRFAGVARSRLRASDSLGRMGGEEFAFILPDTCAAGAMKLAEELRGATEGIELQSRNGSSLGVTVSIGAATTSADSAQTWEALYGQADSALYKSKHSGKNRATRFAAAPAGP